MTFPCLVLDHDDTVVNSTATVHYPSFVEYAAIYHPDAHYTLEDYFKYNFDPGVVAFFRDMVGMTHEDMLHEQRRSGRQEEKRNVGAGITAAPLTGQKLFDHFAK